MEDNYHTVEYTTEQAIVLGHILALTKGMKRFGDKGLNAALA